MSRHIEPCLCGDPDCGRCFPQQRAEPSRKPRKAYLGDGVYLAENIVRGMWVLTSEDGIRATDTIYLEPEVYSALNATINGWSEDDAASEMERIVKS